MPTDEPHAAIRPARREDLPALVAMRNTLNRHELAGCPFAPIQALTLEGFTTLWGATLDDPGYCWRIVEVEGRPVGFGLVYLISPPPQSPGAYIHWAYLEEGQRRRGLGRRLVGEMLAWARQRGADRVELQYIEGNTMAEQFWAGQGFRSYARKCVHSLRP